jgi:hypothetical protein
VWIIQIILALACLAMIIDGVRMYRRICGNHGNSSGDVEMPDSRGLRLMKEDPHGPE